MNKPKIYAKNSTPPEQTWDQAKTVFQFEDEEVIIATSWDDDLDILSADADLVAYLDLVGEADLDGDGEALPVLMPVPASVAETTH